MTEPQCDHGGQPSEEQLLGTKLLAPDCARVADDLEGVIVQFTRCGLPAETKGPLMPALRRLREIAARGTYGSTESDRQSAASAVMIAGDFMRIANCLPDTLGVELREELERMFAGGLDVNEYDGAHDLRAQFAFAATLVAREFAPRFVHAPSGKRRDFLCTVAGVDCGVEVKRPASATRLMKKLDEAAGQLRDLGAPGFVVLDLSRLHKAYEKTPTAMTGAQSLRDVMRGNFLAHTHELVQHCERQVRNPVKRDKYSYIIGAVIFVRIAHWLKHDQSAPVVLEPHSEGPIFWSSMARGLIGVSVVFTQGIGKMLGGKPYARYGITFGPRREAPRGGEQVTYDIAQHEARYADRLAALPQSAMP